MTIIDKACYERGCACYDSRDGEEGIEVVAKREWVGLTQNQINSLCEMSEIAAAVIATELLLKENNHV